MSIVMDEKEMGALAAQLAKNLKTEKDLSGSGRQLKKMTVLVFVTLMPRPCIKLLATAFNLMRCKRAVGLSLPGHHAAHLRTIDIGLIINSYNVCHLSNYAPGNSLDSVHSKYPASKTKETGVTEHFEPLRGSPQ